MKIKGEFKRMKPEYLQKVEIPEKFKTYFWDCSNGETYLEKFILRILTYGTFEEIKYIYNQFPEETYKIAFKYPEIKRGVRFWVKLWKEKELKE